VKLKLNVEFDQEGRALSLDQFTKTFLEAVQKVVRQEFERWHVAHPVSVQKPGALPETKRALTVSKAEAAKILGVSRRTIDHSITLKEIKVFRVGRRVLVPVEGLEAIVKRGSLRTREMDNSLDAGS
jgi:excisionase family DNA binding protein